MQSLVVDDKGTKLAYIDSGVPANASGPYITIFAIHGSAFTALFYERILKVAHNSGVRFVAINRREYPGSSPLTPEELGLMAGGTEEQKTELFRARGLEFTNFVDRFVEQNALPPVTADKKQGGFAILGWSLGGAYAAAAVANVDALPEAGRARFASGLRALILHDVPSPSLGFPISEKLYTPWLDQAIPEPQRIPFWYHWVTAYFKHQDSSARDEDLLSYVTPGTFRPPTIYNISEEDQARILYEPPVLTSDTYQMIFGGPQLNATYKKACYDKSLRELVPNLKVWVVTGGASLAVSFHTQWAIEKDEKAAGGGFIHYKEVPKANHALHWDDPEIALQTFLECAA